MARVFLYVFGLAALALAYVMTPSIWVQLAVMFGVLAIAHVLIGEQSGIRAVITSYVPSYDPPIRLLALSFAALFAGMALAALAAQKVGLGLFWLWLVLGPWSEFLMWLLRRNLRRGGGRGWTKPRPLLYGAADAAILFPVTILQELHDGSPLSRALTIAAGGASLVLFLGVVFAFVQRSRPS
jgi:hypothetical protein